MEFFAVARIRAPSEALQSITLESLPDWCPSIERLLQVHHENLVRAWTVWGEFDISRQLLHNGVRFSLPECPNALVWTLTTGHPPAPEHVVIHATINRMEQDPAFVETLQDLVDQCRDGLEKRPEQKAAKTQGARSR